MWLVIRKSDSTVFAIESDKPPDGAYSADTFEVKEWDGDVPSLGDPVEGTSPDTDPTPNDPDYPAKVQQREDFEALADEATNEIAWLDGIIPQIDAMTAAQVRGVVKRLAQENLEMIKAWRYAIRRLR